MPSFTLVTEGADVLREELLSPFLTNISNFQVYVVPDQPHSVDRVSDAPMPKLTDILYFGKVKDILSHR